MRERVSLASTTMILVVISRCASVVCRMSLLPVCWYLISAASTARSTSHSPRSVHSCYSSQHWSLNWLPVCLNIYQVTSLNTHFCNIRINTAEGVNKLQYKIFPCKITFSRRPSSLVMTDTSPLPTIIFISLRIKLNMKQLRQTILADAELAASRRRFGLFSQPPPLGLGDDSQYLTKQPKKGEDGKPKTSPGNLLGGVSRSGVGKKDFISVPESIYQKDPYKDQLSVELQYQNSMHRRSPMHETDFVPASGSKTITNSPYPHVEEKQSQQKKPRKDENGRVKTEPANVLTNPTSKLEVKLYKPLPHLRDEYSRPQEVEKQEKDLWRSKIIHENMFKSMSHGQGSFTKDRVQYGVDDKVKLLISQKKSHQFAAGSRISHDTKFKLARRGHGDPIGRYPEYVKPRERAHTQSSQVTRTKTEKGEGEKEVWKAAACVLTRPSPSISLMAKNMRRCV